MCKPISWCWGQCFPTKISVNFKGGAKLISDFAASEERNLKQTQ